MNEYKFQWSKQFENGVIVVVRGDSFEEFILDIEKVKAQFIPKMEEKPVVAQPDAKTDSYCPIHNLEMKERINKKNNSKFYSHYIGVYPNGTYCSGK